MFLGLPLSHWLECFYDLQARDVSDERVYSASWLQLEQLQRWIWQYKRHTSLCGLEVDLHLLLFRHGTMLYYFQFCEKFNFSTGLLLFKMKTIQVYLIVGSEGHVEIGLKPSKSFSCVLHGQWVCPIHTQPLSMHWKHSSRSRQESRGLS